MYEYPVVGNIIAFRNIISDIADALVEIDSSRVPFRNYQPGVGPYGEPQLVRQIKEILNSNNNYARAR